MEELFDFPIMKSGVDELVADIIKSNYDNRRLIINDEINNNLLESICLYILKYNQEDKDVPEDKRKPIWICIPDCRTRAAAKNFLVMHSCCKTRRQ